MNPTEETEMFKLFGRNQIYTIRTQDVQLGDVVVCNGRVGEVMFIARYDTKIEVILSSKANGEHLGQTYSGELPNKEFIQVVRY